MQDRKQNQKTVVIGMTQSMDACVAAYLLKRQGYRCIGVAISLVDDQTRNLYPEVFSKCHIQDLHKVAKICEVLEIPFFAVNAHERYFADVIEFVVSSRLAGEEYPACAFCNKFKMDILNEKAQTLGADYIATGHFAKVQRTKNGAEINMAASNDLEQDQSFNLALLTYEELKRLILPLDEIKLQDVIRIFESTGVTDAAKDPEKTTCFLKGPSLIEFVEKRSPRSLRDEGRIIHYKDQTFLHDHYGVHRHQVGEKILETLQTSLASSDLRVWKMDAGTRTIEVAPGDQFFYSRVTMFNFISPVQIDVSKQIDAFVRFSTNGAFFPCVMVYKNSAEVVLEFEQTYPGMLVKGSLGVVYASNLPGARILGAGTILECGRLKKLDRLGLRDPDMTDEKEEEKFRKNITYYF